jgi:hypothetical protein
VHGKYFNPSPIGMTSILIYMLVGGRAFVMGAVMLEKYTLDGCDDVLTDDNINFFKN